MSVKLVTKMTREEVIAELKLHGVELPSSFNLTRLRKELVLYRWSK